MALSAQQELFIEKFLELRNVRKAAEAAGYDASYGYTLFKKLRDSIDERLQDEMVMMQAEAIHVMRNTMEKDDYIPATQAVKMRAAEQVMDRGSLTKKQQLEVKHKELPAIMILPPKDDPVPSAPTDSPEED